MQEVLICDDKERLAESGTIKNPEPTSLVPDPDIWLPGLTRS